MLLGLRVQPWPQLPTWPVAPTNSPGAGQDLGLNRQEPAQLIPQVAAPRACPSELVYRMGSSCLHPFHSTLQPLPRGPRASSPSRVSVVGWGVLDTQVEPEVIVGLPRGGSPPGVCPVSPGVQCSCRSLTPKPPPQQPEHLTSPFEGRASSPVSGQPKASPHLKREVPQVEPPVGGTWASTLAEDGATGGWSGRGLCQPTL